MDEWSLNREIALASYLYSGSICRSCQSSW